jgi:hypothetical protein
VLGRRGSPVVEAEGTFASAVCLFGLITAVGLIRLDRWAWVATMLWVGFVLAVALVAYVQDQPSYPVMVLSVLQVLYLNQSDVQRAFRS